MLSSTWSILKSQRLFLTHCCYKNKHSATIPLECQWQKYSVLHCYCFILRARAVYSLNIWNKAQAVNLYSALSPWNKVRIQWVATCFSMLRILKPVTVSARTAFRFSRYYTSPVSKIEKEPLSPLAKHLHDSIKV